MSDPVARSSPDEEARSGKSLRAHQFGWLSHWMKGRPNPAPVVDSSSLISYKEGRADQKSCLGQGRHMIERGRVNSCKGVNIDAEEIVTRMSSETNKTMERLSPFPTLLCHNTEDTCSSRAQIDHEFGQNISLALAVNREDTVRNFNLMCENNLRTNEKHVVFNSYKNQEANAVSRSNAINGGGPISYIPLDQSNHVGASDPVVGCEKHFSYDNFMCLDQGHCKYRKFYTFLFHEKNMNDNLSLKLRQGDGLPMQDDLSLNKNFHPFFRKKQPESIHGQSTSGLWPHQTSLCNFDQQKLLHECQPNDRVPCSVHNVEAMRICTMVDSVENSFGGTPNISQRAHHFLYAKESCVNLSEERRAFRKPTLSARCKEKMFGGSFSFSPDLGSSHLQGVRIEPLETTTDDAEKEITGNLHIQGVTAKLDSKSISSAQADVMQIVAPKNLHIPMGMVSSALKEDNAGSGNISPAESGSSKEKTRRKKPIPEIPDINEEIPGIQPARSSTDSMKASTSRVHSLNAKHLFPCERISSSECNGPQNPPVGCETGNRWIKRLKLNSSDSLGFGTKSSEVQETSSHKKFGVFFNKVMICNEASLDPVLNRHHGNEQLASDGSQDLLRSSSSMSSEKRNRNLMLGFSWIQRWSKHPTAVPSLRISQPLVRCEPHSLKSGLDELGKKQFPSIAAMALMGKAMNGFRSREFKKVGPVVVWNTKEY